MNEIATTRARYAWVPFALLCAALCACGKSPPQDETPPQPELQAGVWGAPTTTWDNFRWQ